MKSALRYAMFSLLMCVPAHRYEIESGSVITCDTQEQVERFAQLFDGNQQLAINSVNSEEHNPSACAVIDVAYVPGPSLGVEILSSVLDRREERAERRMAHIATKRQILIYSVLLVAAAALPWAIGAAGTVCALASGLCGAAMNGLAGRLDRSLHPNTRLACRLFAVSILYLFVLFAAPLAVRRRTAIGRREAGNSLLAPHRDRRLMVLASRFDLRDNIGLFGMTLHRRILLSELRRGWGSRLHLSMTWAHQSSSSAEVGTCALIGIVVKENVKTESSILGIFRDWKADGSR
jgi:hypothetical protein